MSLWAHHTGSSGDKSAMIKDMVEQHCLGFAVASCIKLEAGRENRGA